MYVSDDVVLCRLRETRNVARHSSSNIVVQTPSIIDRCEVQQALIVHKQKQTKLRRFVK